MRINKFIAQATGLSRRAVDTLVIANRVRINGKPVQLGSEVSASDTVTLDGKVITPAVNTVTIILNKPAGYVSSRAGQGSKTIYDLLPPKFHHLKPVGRLDKDSSGLLLLTNDGDLANRLTHPRYAKEKVYEVELDKPLTAHDKTNIESGVRLEDGISRLHIEVNGAGNHILTVTMSEGRNRQIRRTFSALGYRVTKLHRTQFGPYGLENLASGNVRSLIV